MEVRMRKILTLGVVAVLLAGGLTGCATLFKGENQNVSVNSDTAGAEVLVNGVSYGKAPIQLNLKTNRTYLITVKSGSKEKSYTLNNHVGTLWVVLDVLGGGWPIIIDAVTGAWYEFDNTSVNLNLK
jgi:hypothetical protein